MTTTYSRDVAKEWSEFEPQIREVVPKLMSLLYTDDEKVGGYFLRGSLWTPFGLGIVRQDDPSNLSFGLRLFRVSDSKNLSIHFKYHMRNIKFNNNQFDVEHFTAEALNFFKNNFEALMDTQADVDAWEKEMEEKLNERH